MDNPAIVIPAFNRPQALARLLVSLQRAHYPHDLAPGGIPLVISIDRGAGPQGEHDAEVAQVAADFHWEHGEKQVVLQEQHLGLVDHFHWCGDQSLKYGAVIHLEDDLYVSPVFYAFARAALESSAGDERIAGVSLYALWFNGYTHLPFIPLSDEADAFYLQIPYTQGQALTAGQWSRSLERQSTRRPQAGPYDPLHEMFQHFNPQDWFPARTRYLVETERFYLFPRQSLSTGFGDAGTHFTRLSPAFQTPLQNFKTDYRFKPLDESLAVYDSFFELLPSRLNRLTDAFRGCEYDVDLNATKAARHLRRPYALTTRPLEAPLRTYARAMWPLEANVIEGIPGMGISFGETTKVDWGRLASYWVEKENYEFFTRRRSPGRRRSLRFLLARLYGGSRSGRPG